MGVAFQGLSGPDPCLVTPPTLGSAQCPPVPALLEHRQPESPAPGNPGVWVPVPKGRKVRLVKGQWTNRSPRPGWRGRAGCEPVP